MSDEKTDEGALTFTGKASEETKPAPRPSGARKSKTSPSGETVKIDRADGDSSWRGGFKGLVTRRAYAYEGRPLEVDPRDALAANVGGDGALWVYA